MKDPFYSQQWGDLCRRVQQSAQHHGKNHPDLAPTIADESQRFCQWDPPRSYKELLERFSQAGRMAVAWMNDRPGLEAEGASTATASTK